MIDKKKTVGNWFIAHREVFYKKKVFLILVYQRSSVANSSYPADYCEPETTK